MALTRWGIIGCGKIATKFASDLSFVADAKLNAVASRDLSKARTFAQEFNCPNAFGSYEDLVKSNLVDVIYIATPHAQHHANTILCLKANIPVLCEKAFAINAKQVSEMIQIAKQQKVFLMEAIWTRFNPTIAKLLELLESDIIGEIKHIAADFGFKAVYDPKNRLFDPELTGGSLMDIGIYPLFITKLLLGKPDVIKAVGTLTPTGVDMNCSIALSYANGATATLFSTLAAKTDTICVIYGAKGKIVIPSRFHESNEIWVECNGEKPQQYVFEREGFGYHYEATEVQKCLQERRLESEKLPLQFSLELIEMMDEVRRQIGVVYPNEV